MAHAECIDCGTEVHWRNRRGVRLSELRCACGGKLKGMTAGRASSNAGRKYETCVICGRRRLHVLHPTTRWQLRFVNIDRMLTDVHEPGEPVCGHELVEWPGRIWDDLKAAREEIAYWERARDKANPPDLVAQQASCDGYLKELRAKEALLESYWRQANAKPIQLTPGGNLNPANI